MRNLITSITLALVFLGTSCTAPVEKKVEEAAAPVPETQKSSNEMSQKVVEHHLNSFGANDLAAVMEDYNDMSVIITPDSTFRGNAQIKAFFEGLIPAFPTEGTNFVVDKMVVENELAYIVWHAETPAVIVPLGTDTYIIENDIIVKQTFAGVINPVE